MSEHIKILGAILVMAISIYMMSLVYLKKGTNRSPIIRYMIVQLWVLFGINVGYVLVKYIGINILPEGKIYNNLELSTIFFQLALIGLILYFKFLILVFCHLAGILPGRYVNLLFNIFLFLLSITVVIVILFPGQEFVKIIYDFQAVVALLIFLSEPIIFLITRIFKKKMKGNYNLIKKFVVYYLLKYLLILIVIAFYLILTENSIVESFAYLLVFFFYMAPPFLWLYQFIKLLEKEFSAVSNQDILQTLSSKYNLTPREIEIISLILKGFSNKEIESKLSISYSTVKNHLYNIYRKLGIYSRLELSTFINQKIT